MKPTPIIVAHRGLHHEARENTLTAFSAAQASQLWTGMPWVECDVWLSADEVPVVLHDSSVNRTTTGTGEVTKLSHSRLEHLGVPALHDVLAALAGNAGIVVEIKPSNSVELVRQVRQQLQTYRGPWMVQSFHFENIVPAHNSAVLVEDHAMLQRAVAGLWPNIHAHHSLVDQQLVDDLHASNRKIGAWTVNEAEHIQRLIHLGIDMLITDEPELALRISSSQ